MGSLYHGDPAHQVEISASHGHRRSTTIRTPAPATISYAYAGVDICRDHLDLCHAGHQERLDNTARGARSLARTLARLARASGPYHRILVRALEAEGIAFPIINPKRVRDFARAIGQLAKNDRIDARILEQIGHALRLPPRSAAPEIVRRLQGLEGLRDDLMADLTAWRNRLQQHPGRQEAVHIRAMIRTLGTGCARVEAQIHELIASDVGERTASALLAWMPELGALRPKAAPALAGVAPFACDSGQWRGRRVCHGGRARARSALYMAALVGSAHNEQLRGCYLQMLASGKPKKLALTALMRRLISHLNTIPNPTRTPASRDRSKESYAKEERQLLQCAGPDPSHRPTSRGSRRSARSDGIPAVCEIPHGRDAVSP